MIKCAVLGSPISHSLSPILHRKAYEILGIEGSYEAIEKDEQAFPSFMASARKENWNGFSLTMPLKEVALKVADEIDPTALKIASANTLINNSGVWRAISTDYLAFRKLIDVAHGSKVAIIGGGGTARAAVGALDGKVGAVDILLRSSQRLDALKLAAGSVKITPLDMSADISKYDFVISTVPRGATDQIAENLDDVSGTLLECLYAPWPTNLAAAWAGLNSQVISGLDLLVEQGLHQISFMTKLDFDYSQMRKSLLVAGIEAANR